MEGMEGLLIMAEKPKGKNNMKDICVPKSAIGQEVDPEQGSEVSVTMNAKVSKIEGDHVYLTPMSVNDQDVISGEKKVSEEDELRDRAYQADKEEGME